MNPLLVFSTAFWLALTPGPAPLSSSQPAAAAYPARYMSVSGGGVGTDTDQGSARQAADSMAQTNLQNACTGTLENVKKIFDQCSKLDDNYVCNVNYSGVCKIGF